MRVTEIKSPISFKSGYPTFQSSGHLSLKGHPYPSYNPVYENTNPFYFPNPRRIKPDEGILFIA